MVRHGATFSFHNAGVGEPTANIRIADAMTDDEFDEAARIGIAAVESVDADLFIFGEIGIGNSSCRRSYSRRAWGPAADWVAREQVSSVKRLRTSRGSLQSRGPCVW